MALIVTGIGPASEAPELAGMDAEFVVVLSGSKSDCKQAARLMFERVSLNPVEEGK